VWRKRILTGLWRARLRSGSGEERKGTKRVLLADQGFKATITGRGVGSDFPQN